MKSYLIAHSCRFWALECVLCVRRSKPNMKDISHSLPVQVYNDTVRCNGTMHH